MNIGPCPPLEEPVQVGSPDYQSRSRRECERYIRDIRRVLGPEPEGAKLYTKSNSHDFGDYLEVECRFDPASDAATAYALACEGDGPEKWVGDAQVVGRVLRITYEDGEVADRDLSDEELERLTAEVVRNKE